MNKHEHLTRLKRAYDQLAADPEISEQLRTDIIATRDVMIGKFKKPKKVKPKSRATRWSEAASYAVSALEDLVAIQQEFSDWKDNLPDNLQQSPLGEKLETICDLDIESALSTAQEAEGADIPLGFGRD